MVNINPNRESCMEYMKELIRKELSKTEIIKECIKGFSDVDKSTFYDWYDIVIEQQDIQSWQEDNRIEIIDKRADKIKEEFKGLVFPTTPYEWWKDIIKSLSKEGGFINWH